MQPHDLGNSRSLAERRFDFVWTLLRGVKSRLDTILSLMWMGVYVRELVVEWGMKNNRSINQESLQTNFVSRVVKMLIVTQLINKFPGCTVSRPSIGQYLELI